MVRASARDRGGLRRQGLISSEPSDTVTPAWKKRTTKNVLGPVRASWSLTPLLKPEMMAPMTITTMTPMATPRMVSAARALDTRSDSSAMPTPSRSGVMELLLPQRGDGIEPGGPAGGIDAGHDAHAGPENDADDHRPRRHRRGEGRRRVEDEGKQHPGHDPERGARQGQRRGLRQELAQDVLAP